MDSIEPLLRETVSKEIVQMTTWDLNSKQSSPFQLAQLVGILSCRLKDYGFDPGQGVYKRQPIDVPLSH